MAYQRMSSSIRRAWARMFPASRHFNTNGSVPAISTANSAMAPKPSSTWTRLHPNRVPMLPGSENQCRPQSVESGTEQPVVPVPVDWPRADAFDSCDGVVHGSPDGLLPIPLSPAVTTPKPLSVFSLCHVRAKSIGPPIHNPRDRPLHPFSVQILTFKPTIMESCWAPTNPGRLDDPNRAFLKLQHQLIPIGIADHTDRVHWIEIHDSKSAVSNTSRRPSPISRLHTTGDNPSPTALAAESGSAS